jgi:hypothetical protein
VEESSPNLLILLVIAGLIPVAGFILTITHARGGQTRADQRWRKKHGLLFWVLIPGIAGLAMMLGFIEVWPRIASVLGILGLASTTSLSFYLQKRHEERTQGSAGYR